VIVLLLITLILVRLNGVIIRYDPLTDNFLGKCNRELVEEDNENECTVKIGRG
jgi:hypothetical protein